MRSTTFLQAINDYTFADLITTLLTCINNYFSMDDDSYLPGSLCIMGLAHQLNKAAKLRARSVLPRANHLGGKMRWPFDVPIQGSPHVFRMDAGGRDRPPPRDGRDGCDNRGGRLGCTLLFSVRNIFLPIYSNFSIPAVFLSIPVITAVICSQ